MRASLFRDETAKISFFIMVVKRREIRDISVKKIVSNKSRDKKLRCAIKNIITKIGTTRGEGAVLIAAGIKCSKNSFAY